MDLLLKGKLALVSGSTAGIGLAIAEGLAREEATVVVNGRFEPRVAQAVEAIRQKYPGSKVEGFAGDLSTVEAFDLLIHYGCTKTAQLAISRGLAESTAGTGVTVNAVLPGPTASEGVKDFVSKLADQAKQSAAEFEKFFFEKVRPTSLLKRFESAEEVANLVVYICSPLASATNGASLRVDGGVVRSIV